MDPLHIAYVRIFWYRTFLLDLYSFKGSFCNYWFCFSTNNGKKTFYGCCFGRKGLDSLFV